MKIRFVQLESDAFLTDIDFVTMSPAQRGVYCSLILYMNSNDGKCTFDPPTLSRLCNCQSPEEFEQIWDVISKKFQTRRDVIRHKRVTKELAKAKKYRQARSRAGLSGAKKRWQTDSKAIAEPLKSHSRAIANESKGNVIEKESKALSNTNTTEQALSSSSSLRAVAGGSQAQALHFNQALVSIIHPRTQSGRTCFRNLSNWLSEQIGRGRFNEDIFARVLDYAREASRGRNPAAVLMALMKKELDYSPRKRCE